MYGTKLRSGITSTISGDETIRRVTREKIIVRGNKTIRTLDSTTSFLPLIERYACFAFARTMTSLFIFTAVSFYWMGKSISTSIDIFGYIQLKDICVYLYQGVLYTR